MTSRSKRTAERDGRGQYKPGTSGNPRGRPVRSKRQNLPHEFRLDFLEIGNSLVKITENGKSKRVTISQAINRQLARAALKCERWAVQLWKKLEEKYATEILTEQLDLWEQVLKGEKTIKDFPEGVTDKHIETIRLARSMLLPSFRL